MEVLTGHRELSTGLLETGDYSKAERPGWEMKSWSSFCLRNKEDKEARGRAYQRDFRDLGVVYLMPVLLLARLFHFLSVLSHVWNAT